MGVRGFVFASNRASTVPCPYFFAPVVQKKWIFRLTHLQNFVPNIMEKVVRIFSLHNNPLQYLGAVPGCSTRVEHLGAVPGCSTWVQYLGAGVPGCSTRVQHLGAVPGCSTCGCSTLGGAVPGCSTSVQYLGAVRGCRGTWVQHLGAAPGCAIFAP